jgi:lysophospholipase L1-like esterase
MSASDLLLVLFAALPLLLLVLYASIIRAYRSAAERRTTLLIAGNVTLTLSLLSLLVAGGEVYYRFFYDESDGFQLSMVGLRWTERHYRRNNFDIRDDIDYTTTRTDERTRVTFVGDSYTNGYGIVDVNERFANLLRAANPGWEVHVLAEDGLDTGPLLGTLSGRLDSGYRIDCVVYAYVLNDISDLVEQWQETARRVYNEKPGFLWEHSYLFNTYYYRFKASHDPQLAGYFDYVAAAYADATWEHQRRRLAQLADLVARHAGRLVVVTFPFFELMDDERYRRIHAQLAAFWAEQGIPHIDLLELYRRYPIDQLIVNRYDTHPNALAHELAAREMQELIARQTEPAVQVQVPEKKKPGP